MAQRCGGVRRLPLPTVVRPGPRENRTGAGEPGAGENDRSAVGAGLSPALELQPLDPLAMTIARLEWRSSRHDSGPGPAEEKDKKLKAGSGSDATYR